MKKIIIGALMLVCCYTHAQTHDCEQEFTMVPLFESSAIIDKFDLIESVNTIEDMIEWIVADIQSEDIDPAIGVGYLENLDFLLTKLKKEEDETVTD